MKVTEPSHADATAFTKEMLLDHTVRIVYDFTELYRYDRHLVYVYLQDGTFFNLEIVRAGWARTMTIRTQCEICRVIQPGSERSKRAGERELAIVNSLYYKKYQLSN